MYIVTRVSSMSQVCSVDVLFDTLLARFVLSPLSLALIFSNNIFRLRLTVRSQAGNIHLPLITSYIQCAAFLLSFYLSHLCYLVCPLPFLQEALLRVSKSRQSSLGL